MARFAPRFSAPMALALLLSLSACAGGASSTADSAGDARSDADTPGDTAAGGDAAPDTDAGADADAAADADALPDADAIADADAPPDADAIADADAGDLLPPQEVDGTDAGPDVTPDTPIPAPDLTTVTWGGHLRGTIIALSRTGHTVWVGSRGNPEPADPATIRGGLGRLDLDTGAFTELEAELPQGNYFDFIGSDASGPVPTAGVQEDQGRFVVVAYDGLLVIDGTTIDHHIVTLPGGTVAIPTHLGLTREAGHAFAWLSSDQGLLRLDPQTYQVLDVLGPAALGGAGDVGALAIEPLTGAVYVALYPAEGGGSRVLRVSQDLAVQTLVPGDGDTPTGQVGDILWSPDHALAYIALGAWNELEGGVVSWDGATATTVVVEGQLSEASTGEAGPFGAQVLALDSDHDTLLVGGRIQPGLTGSKGGGLAFVDLTTPNRVAGVPPAAVPFVGMHVGSMVYDPFHRRTLVAMRGQCSEFKLRDYGLMTLWFDDAGGVNLERPLLSGIRALAEVDGELWAGLRDELPGLACEGRPIQTGLVGVRQRRTGVVRLIQTAEGGGISPMPGITDMDVPSGDRAAIATWKDGFFIGSPGSGIAANPAFLGPSLQIESIVWSDEETLWLGGRASHQPGDEPSLHDVGPRGMARIALNSKGGVGTVTHFVVKANQAGQIEGLPSNDVRDILLAGDGGVYAVCATERIDSSSLDHAEEDMLLIDGEPRYGGVVHISSDATVQLVIPSEASPDPRAAALDPQGRLVVADRVQGLVRLGDDGPEQWDSGLKWPAGSIPRVLWFGEGTDMAIGFDTGLAVRYAGTEGFIGDHGTVWTLLKRGDTLLAGTDEGLIRLTPPDKADTLEPPLDIPKNPPFLTVEPPKPPLACLPTGTPCLATPEDCCPGLICGSGFVSVCE